MKRSISCLLFATALLESLVSLSAQSTLPPDTNPIPQPAPLNWQVTARDGMSTTRQAAELVTNLLSGVTSTKLHQYIEVANGANYQDANGLWTESQDLIQLTPDGGAAAVQGSHQAFFAPNLNVSNAITLVSEQKRVFQTRPAGIYYFDRSSGKRVALAFPQDCAAELQPPNVLDYAGAFGQLASMRYIATKAAFESDVIFTSRPQPPETYAGLNPATTTLEVWHEWLNAPVPLINPHTVFTNANPALDVSDEVLDFGDFWFPTGKAFSWDDQTARDANAPAQIRVYNRADDTNSVPVAKHWITGINGASSWLVESVNWSDIQPKLASLPELSRADSLPTGPQGVTHSAHTAFTFPPSAPKVGMHSHTPAIKLARAKAPTPACVIDYTTIASISTNYTFSNSWLYYIPLQGYFGAQVTFQPNCIIKYANSANLLLYGSIVCNGTTNSPSILTSLYDDVGTVDIAHTNGQDTCASVTASEALWLYYITSGVTVSGMDIRWASRGMQFDDNGCGTVTNGIVNSFISSCSTAIYANNCTVSVTNVVTSHNTTSNQIAGCGSVLNLTKQTALADAIASGMEALTNGLTPSSAEYIWGSNYTLATLKFNTNCWVYGLKGLSSFAAGVVDYTTNVGGTVTTNFTYANGPNCTLITPQHALVAWHEGYTNGQIGAYYLFVGTNNVQYTAYVTAQIEVVTTVYSGGLTGRGTNLIDNDISILQFASPVNSNVQPASLLSQNAIRKLPNVGWNPIDYGYTNTCLNGLLPCIGCNYHKQAFAVDLNFVALASPNEPQMDFDTSSQWFPNWAVSIITGDSGSPIYALIENELVLMGAWHTATEAPWCGYDIYTLNTTISNLCVSGGISVYNITSKDLSVFPDL